MKTIKAVPLALAIGTVMSQANANTLTLEEVVVTAQKRSESLQDVPISMLAMSGETIREQGISRMDDFTVNIPAAKVAQSPISTFVFIRGVGTPGSNQGMEQSVAIFHDGIFMGRHQLARAPFMDLERVEVLRGPQSILFGKNSIGGAFSAHTAQPTDEFEASISALYEPGDNEREVTTVVSGPLSDKVRGRLAMRSYEIDGWVENILTGEDGPERDDFTVRGTLEWDLTEDLTVNMKYEKSSFDRIGSSAQISRIDPQDTAFDVLAPSVISGLNDFLSGGGLAFDDKRAVINDGGAAGIAAGVIPNLPGYPNKNDKSENDVELAHLKLEWDLGGDYTLTSITGYAHYDYRDICDCDFSAIPLIQVDATEDYDQWSQELRITSPVDDEINYIAGVYYHRSDLAYRSIEGLGTALAGGGTPNVTRDYQLEQEQEMWAAFGSVTFNITDTTRGTIGLRYSEEKKEIDHKLEKKFTAGAFGYGSSAADYDQFEADNPAIAAGLDANLWLGLLATSEHDIRDRKRDEEHVSWSLNLEHDLNEDVLLYATASTGFKGGGFDGRYLGTNDGSAFEYDEEEAISFELGAKMTLLDGAATLNVAAFRTEIDDYQVSIFDGATSFLVTNAAEAISEGVEMDVRWRATEELTVSAALTWLDSRFESFDNAPCTAAETTAAINAAGSAFVNACTNAADPLSVGTDASGKPNIFAPEWASNLTLDYLIPVMGNMEFRSVLTLNYSDEYFNVEDLDPVTKQDAYTKVDLRVSLGEQDGSWEVALVGKNLTNEEISANTNDQPLVRGNYYSLLDRLRSVAIQGSYRF